MHHINFWEDEITSVMLGMNLEFILLFLCHKLNVQFWNQHGGGKSLHTCAHCCAHELKTMPFLINEVPHVDWKTQNVVSASDASFCTFHHCLVLNLTKSSQMPLTTPCQSVGAMANFDVKQQLHSWCDTKMHWQSFLQVEFQKGDASELWNENMIFTKLQAVQVVLECVECLQLDEMLFRWAWWLI